MKTVVFNFFVTGDRENVIFDTGGYEKVISELGSVKKQIELGIVKK